MEILQPRPYQSLDDFKAMKAVLVNGRRARNGSYYVHTGDLSWWIFYADPQDSVWNHAFLWEDPRGKIVGWTLLSSRYRSFDVFLEPELRGSWMAAEAIKWSATQIGEIVRRLGGNDIRTMWISEEDLDTEKILENLGFRQSNSVFLVMERSLESSNPETTLGTGFAVRSVAGEVEVIKRAEVSYAAFESRLPFDRYFQRYQDFMHSPVYNSDLDVVVVSPQGSFAAFCICWLDDVNHLGHFEPVGVHPDFRRKGFGKAVLQEGMHRMKMQGMDKTMVCCDSENLAAIKLYLSVGFEVTERSLTFVKGV